MRQIARNKFLIVTLVGFFLVLFAVVTACLSTLYTLRQMSFKSVTTTQMAAEMRNDDFWSSNRYNTLTFSAKVQSATSNNGVTTLVFATSDAYGVSCQLANPSNAFSVEKTYTFQVESYQAERQPHGVLLQHCIHP